MRGREEEMIGCTSDSRSSKRKRKEKRNEEMGSRGEQAHSFCLGWRETSVCLPLSPLLQPFAPMRRHPSYHPDGWEAKGLTSYSSSLIAVRGMEGGKEEGCPWFLLFLEEGRGKKGFFPPPSFPLSPSQVQEILTMTSPKKYHPEGRHGRKDGEWMDD